MSTDTVLLIHGPCIRAPGWDAWVDRYAIRGYRCLPSAAPVEARDDDCARWHADPRRRAAAVAVADYYERMLRRFPTPPILVGHCFGGVVVQLLLHRGLGASGIAISLPPAPGRPRPRSAEPTVNYASSRRAPLLLVGGGRDAAVPPSLVAGAVARYQESDAVTGHLEYPEAGHDLLGGPGWEHLAADVLDWAELFSDASAPVRAARPDRVARAVRAHRPARRPTINPPDGRGPRRT